MVKKKSPVRNNGDQFRLSRGSRSDNEKEPGPLLSPGTSIVLLVDPQHAPVAQLGNAQDTLAVNVATLCRYAQDTGVPVLSSVLANHEDLEGLLPEGISADTGACISRRTVLNPWDDNTLVSSLNSHDRRRLVLLGQWDDVTVSMAALSALLDGYDVYIVTDCCPGLIADRMLTPLRRLVQAGVVPVTWRQVVFEWMRHRPELLRASFLRDSLG